MSENPDEFSIIDDDAPAGDEPASSPASLRSRRASLRRQDARRSRVASWTGCIVSLGAGLQLALVAWRASKAGGGGAAVVFGVLCVASFVASAFLGLRAWANRAETRD